MTEAEIKVETDAEEKIKALKQSYRDIFDKLMGNEGIPPVESFLLGDLKEGEELWGAFRQGNYEIEAEWLFFFRVCRQKETLVVDFFGRKFPEAVVFEKYRDQAKKYWNAWGEKLVVKTTEGGLTEVREEGRTVAVVAESVKVDPRMMGFNELHFQSFGSLREYTSVFQPRELRVSVLDPDPAKETFYDLEVKGVSPEIMKEVFGGRLANDEVVLGLWKK